MNWEVGGPPDTSRSECDPDSKACIPGGGNADLIALAVTAGLIILIIIVYGKVRLTQEPPINAISFQQPKFDLPKGLK